MLETQHNFDIIVVGVGVKHSDIITILMANDNAVIISPVFDTSNQQCLTIYIQEPQTDKSDRGSGFLDRLVSELEKVPMFASTLKVVDLTDGLTAVRLMPCYFSPLIDPMAFENDAINESVDLSKLAELGEDKGSHNRKPKFKFMTLEQLQVELDSREKSFRDYFKSEKSKNSEFSLKDITDADMLKTLDESREIRRVIKFKSEVKK